MKWKNIQSVAWKQNTTATSEENADNEICTSNTVAPLFALVYKHLILSTENIKFLWDNGSIVRILCLTIDCF